MSKSLPENRTEFKLQCLRKLGHPVVQINVTDDQIEDCIEDALKFYADYHYDGSEHVYYTITIQQEDIDNRYVIIPDSFLGITEVYSLNSQAYSVMASDMFSGLWELSLNMAFSSASGSVVSYYMNRQNYEFLNQILIGQTPIRYNRRSDKLYIDFNWNKISEGSKIVVDGYVKVDPNEHTEVWSDRWLVKYAVAKIKYIWGSNMAKFEGMQLPGGITLNGSKYQDDAKEELQQLEDEMQTSYSIPPRDVVA